MSALTRQDPTQDYFSAFHDEVNREKNDRGAAILLACHVERCLRYAIAHNLTEIKDAHDVLFSARPSLHGFNGKIQFGNERRLFGKETKKNLECIKAIRNAFAHAIIPISFDTIEVRNVCEEMTMPEILPPRSIDPKTYKPTGSLSDNPTPRERFQRICEATGHNLYIVGAVRVIAHPSRPADQAGAARAVRMAVSGLRPLRRPVATMEQRSA